LLHRLEIARNCTDAAERGSDQRLHYDGSDRVWPKFQKFAPQLANLTSHEVTIRFILKPLPVRIAGADTVTVLQQQRLEGSTSRGVTGQGQ
jgi:hypothetical protein